MFLSVLTGSNSYNRLSESLYSDFYKLLFIAAELDRLVWILSIISLSVFGYHISEPPLKFSSDYISILLPPRLESSILTKCVISLGNYI